MYSHQNQILVLNLKAPPSCVVPKEYRVTEAFFFDRFLLINSSSFHNVAFCEERNNHQCISHVNEPADKIKARTRQ
jgi:hypothetical protein